MADRDALTEQFEASRERLRRIAWRMLGSRSEADDAVQEAWLRLARDGGRGVDNLGGWLTTVVARVCLDMLRGRKARREEPGMERAAEPAEPPSPSESERDEALGDTVGAALLVVLDTLSPAERVAFVLHDLFDLSFDEIAPIVERTPVAARQLASRARRRVRGATLPESDVARQRRVVSAFLAASRDGDFAGLMAVLAPDVVLRADAAAVLFGATRPGAPPLAAEIRGAAAVAATFKGQARVAQPALVDGAVGVVVAPGGKLLAAFEVRIAGEKIVAIDIIGDPEQLREIEWEVLPSR